MSYRVEVLPRAVAQLRRLDAPSRLRIQAAVELLAEQPRPPKAERIIGGAEEWRVRTGDVRLVYAIDDARETVCVVALGRPVRAIPRAPRLAVPPPDTPPDLHAAATGPTPEPAADEDVHGRGWFRRRSRQ